MLRSEALSEVVPWASLLHTATYSR